MILPNPKLARSQHLSHMSTVFSPSTDFLSLSPSHIPCCMHQVLLTQCVGDVNMSNTPEEQPYIFTTLRFDPALRDNAANTAASGGIQSSVYLLQYHFDRLKEAAATLGGYEETPFLNNALASPPALDDAISEAIQAQVDLSNERHTELSGPFRVRMTMKPGRGVDIQCPQIPQTYPILFPETLDDYGTPSWTVYLDTQPTEKSVHTSFKTSQRHAYDRARQAAGCTLNGSIEVLLYNPASQVMDASITTPYFHRDGRWVTPPMSAGGQQGTTRRWALANHLCSEANVAVDSLREGEVVWLSNAARGFFTASFASRLTTSE